MPSASINCTINLVQPTIRRRSQARVQGIITLEPHAQHVAALPATVMFVVDVSSSMGEGRAGERGIELLQAALNQAVTSLPPTTTVGVVAFNESFHWVQRPAVLSSCTKPLSKAISKLRASGMTRFAEPLVAATGVLRGISGPRVLVLLTDGQSSVNTADDEQRCQTLCAELQQSGIDLWVFGMGIHYDYDVLHRWASLAGGSSMLQHITAGSTALPQLFGQLATRIATTAAHDVLVALQPSAGGRVAELIRTKPQTRRVPVLRNGEAIDDLGLLQQDGAHYSFELIGDPPPVGQGDQWTVATLNVSLNTADGIEECSFPLVVALTDDPTCVAPMDQTIAQTMLATAARVAALDGVQNGDQTLLTRAQTMATQVSGNVGTTLLADIAALGSGSVDQQRTARTRLVLPDDELTQLGS